MFTPRMPRHTFEFRLGCRRRHGEAMFSCHPDTVRLDAINWLHALTQESTGTRFDVCRLALEAKFHY